MDTSADPYVEACRRVAGNVRRLRRARGLTQEAVAGAAGLAARHLQKVEAGEVNLTLATLVKVAGALGADVSELFARGEPEGDGDG